MEEKPKNEWHPEFDVVFKNHEEFESSPLKKEFDEYIRLRDKLFYKAREVLGDKYFAIWYSEGQRKLTNQIETSEFKNKETNFLAYHAYMGSSPWGDFSPFHIQGIDFPPESGLSVKNHIENLFEELESHILGVPPHPKNQ